MKTLIVILSLFIAGTCFAEWLVWDPSPPEAQVVRYNIYRGKGSSSTPGDLVGAVFPPTTAFDVSDFISGGKSVFAVTALNVNGESVGSNKVTIQKK